MTSQTAASIVTQVTLWPFYSYSFGSSEPMTTSSTASVLWLLITCKCCFSFTPTLSPGLMVRMLACLIPYISAAMSWQLATCPGCNPIPEGDKTIKWQKTGRWKTTWNLFELGSIVTCSVSGWTTLQEDGGCGDWNRRGCVAAVMVSTQATGIMPLICFPNQQESTSHLL